MDGPTGYTLIVTEKPDAARRIASALNIEGKTKKTLEGGVPVYVAQRREKVVVVPALGHLYTVAAARSKNGFPVFDYEWVPRYKAEKKASRSRMWLQTFSKLAKGADQVIDACDYDIEGSIIGYCILKYACDGREKEAKRMKYSTLTKEELEKAYSALMPHLDFPLIEAGLARHEVDWLYGINLSRALTRAAKKYSRHYTTLSTGRVQGPTLEFLVSREKEIACFVPSPYWTIKAKAQICDEIFDVEHEKKAIETKEEAKNIVKRCKKKTGRVEDVENKQFKQLPPFPFDLSSLQHEAYQLFRYTPMRTLSTAQRLYLDALISYPRTDSQRLPPAIGYQKILKNLSRNLEYTRLAEELLAKSKLKPIEGKKWDSAHPAIYPTGKFPKRTLNAMENNIYNLVVRRFLAAFAEASTRRTAKFDIAVEGEKFILGGTQTLTEGWFRFYKSHTRIQETPLPDFSPGDSVFIKRIISQSKFTRPPARYNTASLLKKMEESSIGTKATRAGIMQTLYDRNYVCGEKMLVTDIGFEVTEVLERYCPSIIAAKFTWKLEEMMKSIQLGTETKQRIVLQALKVLKPVMTSLKENEKVIGELLTHSIEQEKLREKTIGPCPTCHSGKLIIQRSRKTGKRFVGCTNYFNDTCKTAFPLPQKGAVKPSGKACKSCGCPTVITYFKGKQPWELCFNTGCSSKTGCGKAEL